MATSNPGISEREKRLISRETKREEEERNILLQQEVSKLRRQRDEYLRQLTEKRLDIHTDVLSRGSQSLKQPPPISPLRGDEIYIDDNLKSRSQSNRTERDDLNPGIQPDKSIQGGQSVRMHTPSNTRNVLEESNISERGYSAKDFDRVLPKDYSRDYDITKPDISVKQKSKQEEESRFSAYLTSLNENRTMNETEKSGKQSMLTQTKDPDVRLFHSTPRSELMTTIDVEIRDLDRRLAILRQEKSQTSLKESAHEKPYKSILESCLKRDRDTDVYKQDEFRKEPSDQIISRKIHFEADNRKEIETNAAYADSKGKIMKEQCPDREPERYIYEDRDWYTKAPRSNRDTVESGVAHERERYERFLPSGVQEFEMDQVPRQHKTNEDTPVNRSIAKEVYPPTHDSKPGYWVFIPEGSFPYSLPVGKQTDIAAEKHNLNDFPTATNIKGERKVEFSAPTTPYFYNSGQKVKLEKDYTSDTMQKRELLWQQERMRLGLPDEATELRKKRELALLAKEEELKRRETEYKEKQSWIEYQEEIRKREESADPYEEAMKLKENELKEKFEKLQAKEAELAEREARLTEAEKEAVDSATYQSTINKQTKEATKVSEKDRDKETNLAENAKEMIEKLKESVIDTQCTVSANTDKQFLFPKFSVFSGDDQKSKSEATFEEWKYEVNCIQNEGNYREDVIAQAIRKSLRGQAKRVLLPMGTSATVQEILSKLDGIFGNVATGESVLQEFYTAEQKQDETVAAWGLRLEEILQKAVVKGHVKSEEKNDMLRNKFWRSLRSDRLKNATRSKYESISSFELLRRAVREEEHEMKTNSAIQNQQMRSQERNTQNKGEEDSKLESLMTKLAALENQIKEINQQRKPWWQRRRPNQQFNQQDLQPQRQGQPPPQNKDNTQKKSEN